MTNTRSYEDNQRIIRINKLIPEAIKVADSQVPRIRNDYDKNRWNRYYLRAMNRMAVKDGLRCV